MDKYKYILNYINDMVKYIWYMKMSLCKTYKIVNKTNI